MIYATGTYNPRTGAYRMKSTTPPYDIRTYIGYTLAWMKRKYRQDNNLKYKRIEWIII